MSGPGKMSFVRQHFSASLPANTTTASNSTCNKDCSCACKCCRGNVNKFISFDPESNKSSGHSQKMVRFSTADMMLLLCVAQSRENFWSNQYYKANLLEDYAALIVPFNIEEGTKPNIPQLKEIMETITSGYRRAVVRLSATKALTVRRPPELAPSYAGLRCNCEQCSLMPWNKLQQLEDHQWLHKSSDNWHCRLCFRRYFIQHTLLLHLSRQIKRNQAGVLMENEAYKQRVETHRQQELTEQKLVIQPVEELHFPRPGRTELDFEAEPVALCVSPTRPNPRKRCHLTACPHCAYRYRFSYSHQLHMKKHHQIQQFPPKCFHCASCERIFRTRHVYLKHLRRVRKKYSLRVRKYVCDCSLRYQLKRTLTAHEIKVHTRLYTCLICSNISKSRCCHNHTRKEVRKAINEYSLRRREQLGLPPLKKPRRRRYSCDECDKVYTNIGALKEHKQRKHLNRKDFICESCGKEFYTAKNIYEHVRRVHTMIESVRCELCNLTISDKSNFKRHCESGHHLKLLAEKEGRSYDENPVYQSTMIYCEVCDRQTHKAAYKLHCQTKLHLALLENQDSQPICKICHKEFAAKVDLFKHMQKVHVKKAQVTQAPQKFYCNSCKVKITGSANYRRHCKTTRHLENLKDSPRLIDIDSGTVPMFYCEFCERNLKGERIYKNHCESKLHKRRLTTWVEPQND